MSPIGGWTLDIGWVNLMANAFNQLGQCTSNCDCKRAYCYAEIAIVFASNGHNHCQYSFRLPMERFPVHEGY